MKIAFLADPLDTFKTYKDTTYSMMVEAGRRGHELYAFTHGDMAFEGDAVIANVARIALTGDAQNWYRAEMPTPLPLTAFDAVVERTDPPFDMEYIYAPYLLELAQSQGARI